MRLVESSEPGAVDAFAARQLLEERLLLTRSVIASLREAEPEYTASRPRTALDMLLDWVAEHCAYRVEPHADDGLDAMVVPEGAEEVMAELRAGAAVAEDLFMAWTADTQSELRGDCERIRRDLETYPY